MSKSTMMITAFAATVCSANLAMAEFTCQVTSKPVELISNGSTKGIGSVWGGVCPHVFKTTTSTIKSTTIMLKPKNGKLTVFDENGARYIPNKDFKGIDYYTIKYCGNTMGTEGCATVEFEMKVQ